MNGNCWVNRLMTGYSHRLLSFWQGNVESNLRILRINNFFWGWAMTRNCRSCAYMYWILVVSLVRTSLSQGLGRGLKACCRAFGCVASIIHSFIHPSIHPSLLLWLSVYQCYCHHDDDYQYHCSNHEHFNLQFLFIRYISLFSFILLSGNQTWQKKITHVQMIFL